MNDSTPSAENLFAASILFGVLGKTLSRELERDDVSQLITSHVFAEVPFGENQKDTMQGITLLRSWTNANADGLSQETFDDIRHDFFYLFAGVDRPLATPWESTYFNDAHLMFGKQTLEVRDWYKRYDLMVERKNREPDDHIGYELSFIAHLAQVASETLQAGDNVAYKKHVQALQDFLIEHPLRWVFIWTARVKENARSSFYEGLALLVSGSLHALSIELGIDISIVKQCAMPQKLNA